MISSWLCSGQGMSEFRVVGRQAACSYLTDQSGSSGRAWAGSHPVALVLHLSLRPKACVTLYTSWGPSHIYISNSPHLGARPTSTSVTAMHGTVTQSYEWGWCISGYTENSKTSNFESQEKMQTIPCICMQTIPCICMQAHVCVSGFLKLRSAHICSQICRDSVGRGLCTWVC